MSIRFGDHFASYREQHDDRCRALDVSFGITGSTLDPVAVSKGLSLSPSRSHTAGESYVTRRGQEMKRPYGLWAISTASSVDSTSAETRCRALLERLEPVKDVIGTYVEDGEFRVAISIWWESNVVTGGFTLSADTLSRLSQLCDDLDCSFVSTPDDEG